jgi:hypothetical protein
MRTAATVAGLLGALLATVAVAFAAPLPIGVYYNGVSAHKRYAVSLLTGCDATGCKTTSGVSIDLSVGKKGKTSGKCPYATDALSGGTLKHRRFSASGQFYLTGHRIVTFAMTGKFTSSKRVTGKITGPAACGGSDTFTAKLGPPS